MRIAARLVLTLGVTLTVVMAAYAMIAFDQRGTLLRNALIRETELLGQAVQIVTDNALRDGRFADLDRVLGRIVADPETYAAVVFDSGRELVAGGPAEAAGCLLAALDDAGARPVRGWSHCDGQVRWVALPLAPPAATLVVARRATVVAQDLAASRRRILLTTLFLAGAAALVVLLVIRYTVSRPLADVLVGVRSLGGPEPPPEVPERRHAGELRELAAAFNEMARRLEGKRNTLVRELEERLALERRLRAAETFAALGHVAGGVAHELGSPLNVIRMRAEAIPRAADRDEATRQAEEIVSEVDRVAGLVRRLIREARHHPVEPRPLDLREVVDAVIRAFQPRIREHGIALECGRPTAPVTVMGDASLLEQALRHLVGNAIQALAAAGAPRELEIRVVPAGGVARVEVEDNAGGIPEGELPHIFEPFYTSRAADDGMGLGLPISRGIAEEHGGALELSLTPHGVLATLTLPTGSRGG